MPILNENEAKEFKVNTLFDKNNKSLSKTANVNETHNNTKRSNDLIKRIQKLKEGVIKDTSFETLSTKLPIIAVGYFDSLNEKTGFIIKIDKDNFNVHQIIYGPFYNKTALKEWIGKMNELIMIEDFIYLEIFALSSFIDSIEANAINGKIKDNELDIGTMTYGDRKMPTLRYKL